METASILYPYSYSTNFPKEIRKERSRDNIVQTIKDLLDQESSIVFITGEDEIGKSSFMAQFAKRIPNETVACFIKPTNQFSSNIENAIYDLINQIHFILTDNELPMDVVMSQQTLLDYFTKLHRFSKGKKTYYIILDGLENINDAESFHFKTIIDVLPLGIGSLKFLFSDNKKKVYSTFLEATIKRGKIKSTNFPLSGFSYAETEYYLAGLKLEPHQIQEVLKLSNHLPGRIKNIYEILESGVTYDELVSSLGTGKYSDILEFQWNQIDHNNQELLFLVAVLALEENNYSIEDLSNLFKISSPTLEAYLEQLSFLAINPENKIIQFKSLTIKKYFSERLIQYKSKVDEAIVNHLIENSSSIESLLELPKRYEKSNNFEALLKLLSEENFSKIIEKKESLTFLEEQTEIGIRAAIELRRYPELFRLSIGKSSISELKESYIWETEIEAKIELKQLEEAFNLAQESILKEDKFRLLVFLAKKLKEKGLTVSEEILNDIKTLYNQINPAAYGSMDDVVEIAANLLYNLPDLAIDFVDKLSNTRDANVTTDVGFAKLALLLKKMEDSGGYDSLEKLGDISSRIRNPKLKNLTNAFGFLFNNNDVEKFLEQIDRIPNVNDQLQIIRIYLQENKKGANIDKVIDRSIDLLLKLSSEYPINASTLAELSEPLPFIKAEKTAKHLISRFEPFFQTSKEKGPTMDHIRFLLNLSCSELSFNAASGQNLFIDINQEISNVNDIGLKADCYSLFYSRIKTFDKENYLERNNRFESDTLTNIEACFKDLLSETAQHFKISRRIIREVSRVNPKKGIEFSLQLNTSLRRDQGLLAGLKSYLKNVHKDIDNKVIRLFLSKMTDYKVKDHAAIEVVERFSLFEGDVIQEFPFLLEYFDGIAEFYSNVDKCSAYSIVIDCLSRSTISKETVGGFNNEIKQFRDNLNDKFERINFGFKLATSYLKLDKALAAEYHEYAVQERENLFFVSPASLTLYYNSLRLTIQSFCGLFAGNLHNNEDTEIIIQYIKYLPDPVLQINLFSYLLLKVYDRNKRELFNKIFEKTIRPYANSIISETSTFSRGEITSLILEISPVTYLYQKDLFDELYKKCAPLYRDFCLDSVCDYLISKRIPSEEYALEPSDLKMESDDILSVLNLLELVSRDHLISDRIGEIKDCQKNNCFAKDIIPMISSRLTAIVDSRLPDPNNIKHKGYKLLCRGNILSIQRNKETSKWQDLFKEVKQIPNKSDRAYVLSNLLLLLPEGFKGLTKAQILKEATSNLDDIHSFVARVERYSDVFSIIKDVNLPECKNKMKKAIEDSVFENNVELLDEQKEIIDCAYSMDPTFAEELIKIVDDDPARKPIAQRLKRNVKVKDLEKDFLKDKINIQDQEVKYMAQVCWDFVKKLNAKRVKSKSIDEAQKWLTIAHKLPISETFPIYSAFIANANVRWENRKSEVKDILRPLFDFSIKNLQMIRVLSIRSKRKSLSTKEILFTPLENQLIVKPGERELALEFIRKWIREEVVEFVKICDPYFSSADIDLVKEIFMIKPEINILILAQKEHCTEDNMADLYQKKWEDICDQDPPKTRVVIVGYRDGKGDKFLSPNHDRWYVTYNSGLRVGTSFNSLGVTKNSEITIMSGQESKNIEKEILNKYLDETETYHKGNRLLFSRFSL